MLSPLNGNGTTLTFVPHKDSILLDGRIAIKTSTLDVELVASNILSTSFFSKEMTLLSQTLTLLSKALSFATRPSSSQVFPALSNWAAVSGMPLRLTGPHQPITLNSPLKLKF